MEPKLNGDKKSGRTSDSVEDDPNPSVDVRRHPDRLPSDRSFGLRDRHRLVPRLRNLTGCHVGGWSSDTRAKDIYI